MHKFVKHVHFVGIGGIGMSGIAEVLLKRSFIVSGSDLSRGPRVEELEKAGAKIMIGHHASNIEGVDVVVSSSAIDTSNPEVEAALAQTIPVIPRAQMLGELMRFKRGLAVAGTHGKTTTTSLLAAILASAKMDPTVVVGGVVNRIKSNAYLGSGEYIVVEADESDASFLHLQPVMAIVTNIDADHMDTYGGDFEKLKETYLSFLHNLPFYGLAVLCFDDPSVREIAKQLQKPFISYGFEADAEYRAVDVRQEGANSHFTVLHNEQSIGEFTVALPGKHNVLNALAAIVMGRKIGIDYISMNTALTGFSGINRRFQQHGELAIADAKVSLVDDYAHHPTEVKATIEAALNCWPERRCVFVFQPHRYTRTRDLFDEFAALLAGVQDLIIMQVYAAGETMITSADSKALCRAIRKRGGDPLFCEDFAELEQLLATQLVDGDVIITMGAGDIGRFALKLATERGTA